MATLEHADWYRVLVPDAVDYADLLRTIGLCQNTMRVRVSGGSDDPKVEVLANSAMQAVECETVFQQILADQLLRRAIRDSADPVIAAIADSVLLRAGAC